MPYIISESEFILETRSKFLFDFALMSSRMGYEIMFPRTIAIPSSLVVTVSHAAIPSSWRQLCLKLSHITVVTSQLGEYCWLAIFSGLLLSI